MFRKSQLAGLCVVATVAAVALAQFQVNPQVNTGIYAGPGPTAVRYANTYSEQANLTSNAYRSGAANLGYASMANSVNQTGANTVFNISSRTADTRQGYATTGVYAANGVINGQSPADQAYRNIPASAINGNGARPGFAPYPTMQLQNAGGYGGGGGGYGGGGQVNAQVNAQVNGQVNAQVNGAAY